MSSKEDLAKELYKTTEESERLKTEIQKNTEDFLKTRDSGLMEKNLDLWIKQKEVCQKGIAIVKEILDS